MFVDLFNQMRPRRDICLHIEGRQPHRSWNALLCFSCCFYLFIIFNNATVVVIVEHSGWIYSEGIHESIIVVSSRPVKTETSRHWLME